VCSTPRCRCRLDRCTDDVAFFSNAPIDILPTWRASRTAELRSMWETIYARYSEMRHETPILVAESDKVAVLIRAFFRKRTNRRMVQFDIAPSTAFATARSQKPRGHRHLRSRRAGAGARPLRRADRQDGGET
jgi:hypothetical protein